MEILEYFSCRDPAHWLDEIGRCDWEAGRFLHELLLENRFRALCGESAKVLLLTEGDRLVSFCGYEEQDDIRRPDMKPWAGFVYTFPEYRGKRRMGKLLERAYALARDDGYDALYISTNEDGLYEKYGFTFLQMMQDFHGHDSRVYRRAIEHMDYSGIIGRTVCGTVDRPLGSAHPRHPEMIYPLNYGYVDGVCAGDGAEQDVYIFGTDMPLRTFSGQVVAVLHRLNDCEDKWIVSVDGKVPGRDEILQRIAFQEQYFMGELYM
ncbi:MAG: GNAT family N-acetyltransferase [Clostridia bacterium]|nr:GNAT family N-acetyltransferase [Clostridia bacterium]